MIIPSGKRTKKLWNITMILIGKSTISIGHVPVRELLVITRGYHYFGRTVFNFIFLGVTKNHGMTIEVLQLRKVFQDPWLMVGTWTV
jgi:hypothetical protein